MFLFLIFFSFSVIHLLVVLWVSWIIGFVQFIILVNSWTLSLKIVPYYHFSFFLSGNSNYTDFRSFYIISQFLNTLFLFFKLFFLYVFSSGQFFNLSSCLLSLAIQGFSRQSYSLLLHFLYVTLPLYYLLRFHLSVEVPYLVLHFVNLFHWT